MNNSDTITGSGRSILYINASVRAGSRTDALSRYLLEKLGGSYDEIRLCETAMPVLDEAFLTMRDKAVMSGVFDSDVFSPAKKFAEADEIVISAPYYDLSFPAALKQFFEQINVIGLTFAYGPDGMTVGLCKAKRLFYVTTSGGPMISDEYGFGYVKALSSYFYKIGECVCFKAEGLDIIGADAGAILSDARKQIDGYFGK